MISHETYYVSSDGIGFPTLKLCCRHILRRQLFIDTMESLGRLDDLLDRSSNASKILNYLRDELEKENK